LEWRPVTPLLGIIERRRLAQTCGCARHALGENGMSATPKGRIAKKAREQRPQFRVASFR